MGVVYEAEQREPVRRRVALKTMKAGLDTREVIGRFETERQALAVMDHPGIARVFDAGATPEGRPFFVMELVRGLRVDEFCDQNRLDVRGRVSLFIKICDAVQHAHLKGVVHRDLKPGNVLVSGEGIAASPTIIDFGVAKATGMQLAEHTVLTTLGQAPGTLAYMSPEQAEMGGIDVDTRSDVFSLGVLLHELLTGRLPVDPARAGGASFLARLVDRDVAVPSLPRTVAELPPDRADGIARARGTTPRGLARALTGDLQWIVARALEKDRIRRYATVSAMAMDLRRYLGDEPVEARPPARLYSFGKFVRRNRQVVVWGAVAVLALCSGGLAATSGMLEARAAQAVAARDAARAREVSRFLVDLFEVSDPGEARGSTVTAREILDQGAERIRTELSAEPAVQGQLMVTMGEVYRNLGLYDRSRALTEEAVRILDTSDEADPETRAGALGALATLYEEEGRYEEAEPLARRGLTLLTETLGEVHPAVGSAYNNLGLLVNRMGRYDEAAELYDRALRINETVLGPDHPTTASNLGNLAVLKRKLGRYAEAEALQRRTLEIAAETLGTDHPAYTTRLVNLAVLYRDMGRESEAEPLMREALAIDERIFGPDHPYVAIDLANLADLLLRSGRGAAAEDLARRALEIDRSAHGPGHDAVGEDLRLLARAHEASGRMDEAERDHLEALRILEAALGASHPRVAPVLTELGGFYVRRGRWAAAEPLVDRALAILGDASIDPTHPATAQALHELAVIHGSTDRLGEAEALFDRALAMRETLLGPHHPALIETLDAYAELEVRAGHPGRAEELRARSRRAREGLSGQAHRGPTP